MSAKPKVIYWNGGVAHYIVGRFNAIARRGNLGFEAWFQQLRLADRSWQVNPAEWEFPARLIPARKLMGMRLQIAVPELNDSRPELMVSGYSNAAWALSGCAARAMGIRVGYRLLPTFDTWTPRHRRNELVKAFLFRAMDGVKVPGPDGAAFSRRFGMPDERIVSVTQSIDVQHYASARRIDAGAREEARRRLGLRGCVFIYVGRLWSGKGLDYLFEAYREVRRRAPNSSLMMVGDGVHEAHYRDVARGIPDVVFAGFVQPRDLPAYYALADVLVFPTLGDPHGLVVEEAMAAGLPVICTESAGDIRSRLPDGEAGYVIAPADASAMADRMLLLSRDTALRARLGQAAQRCARTREHCRYAEDFERFVDIILSKPRRRTPHAALAHAIGTLVIAACKGDSPAPLIGKPRPAPAGEDPSGSFQVLASSARC